MKCKAKTKKLKMPDKTRQKAKRNYQDSLFRFMFNNKESAIELYNALEGTDYGMDTEVEFKTLDNVFYVDGKNDLGFTIDGRFVVLTEHQSTINNNMPVRFLEYIADTYEDMLKNDNLFLERAHSLMTPEFFVIYTGERDWKRKELRLSDSFLGQIPDNSLELVVKIIDVRYNKKEAEQILLRSEKLRGYSLLIENVRTYKRKGYGKDEAIDLAIARCIEENVLRDFLIQHGMEVKGMLSHEMSMEKFVELRGDEKWKEGHAQGLEEGHAQGLEEGHAQGLEEGLAQGLEEGHSEEKILIARNLLTKGLPMDFIAETTGLSLEEIQKLSITE